MVIRLGKMLDRNSPRSAAALWGTRAAITAAVILTVSAFTKGTGSVGFDLPRSVVDDIVQVAETSSIKAAQAYRSIPLMKVATPVPAAAASNQRPAPFARMWQGMASWYGQVLQDHFTASGHKFDEFELTAAHRTLPFGSKVKVTDLRNRKSVIVTITDRGVLAADRVIDLSYGAAQELGMVRRGVDPVKLEVLTARQVAMLEREAGLEGDPDHQ